MAKTLRISAALLMLVFGVSSLTAHPDYDTWITYYTDGTYTQSCGYQYYGCQSSWGSGCQTQWEIETLGEECDSPCGGDGC